MLGVTALWGWSYVVVQDAVALLPVPAFLAYRFLGAAAVIGLFQARAPGRITAREALGGTVAGGVLFTAYALQTVGLEDTTVSNAAFITGLAVVFTPLLGALVLRTPPRAHQAAGAALALAGLSLLTLKGLSVNRGDVLMLACALSFTVQNVLLAHLGPGTRTGPLTLVQLAVVGLAGLLWSLATGSLAAPSGQTVWLALAVTAVPGSALAFFVKTKAFATSSPHRIALIMAMEPVFAGVSGYWLSGDTFTAVNLCGAALIVSAILLAETGRRRAAPRRRRGDRASGDLRR
ncbi:DMT family transporter [Streptomyces roseifaciens]|uniref:DMT family transporter n=1 Tax=Streptomyces roseifaciens TaxID=1488406 RepID=UPI00071827C8|nr:DMT family transporter [Streptomyces roseifaciens]